MSISKINVDGTTHDINNPSLYTQVNKINSSIDNIGTILNTSSS